VPTHLLIGGLGDGKALHRRQIGASTVFKIKAILLAEVKDPEKNRGGGGGI
jgi:hypothetical protein